MARRRRSRRYGGTVGVNLGDLPLFGDSVNSTDVFLGMGAGLLASAVVKGLAKKFAPAMYAQFASTAGMFMPAVVSAAGAALVKYGGPKTGFVSKHKADGMAIGAFAVGAAVSLWDFARANLSSVGGGLLDFSGTVGVNLGGYNMLIDDSAGQGVNGMNGLIVTDHSDSLSELAAISMGGDDDGIDALMQM